jgi:hypothetical protein
MQETSVPTRFGRPIAIAIPLSPVKLLPCHCPLAPPRFALLATGNYSLVLRRALSAGVRFKGQRVCAVANKPNYQGHKLGVQVGWKLLMMDGQPTSSEAAVLKMAVCRKEEKGFTLTFQVRFVAFSAAWPIAALMTDCPCKGPERSGDGKASRNVRATDPWDLPRLIPSACDSNRPPRTAATSRSALSRWSVSRCMLCVVQHLPCLYIIVRWCVRQLHV